MLIDVPIAKDHGITRLTLGGKNLLGVILDPGAHPQQHRPAHGRPRERRAGPRSPSSTPCASSPPTGPPAATSNDVERLDTVIASPDIVAADSYAATLFDLSGADIPYVQAAYDMGLGEMDLDKVRIRDVRV